MASRNRIQPFLIGLLALALSSYAGVRLFCYFTHKTPPVFQLTTVIEGGTYHKTLQATVVADSSYKIGHVIIKCDETVITDEAVKSAAFDMPFTLDTKAFPDGQHNLSITAYDTSYHKNSTTRNLTITVDNTPLHAAFADTDYVVYQGKTLHLRIASNKQTVGGTIQVAGRTYSFSPSAEGSTTCECFIPIECEAQPIEQMLTANVHDTAGNQLKLSCRLTIKTFDFVKQKGFTVPDEKVEMERQAGASMNVLEEALEKCVAQSPHRKLWSGPFLYPIDVERLTTPFGEIRTNSIRGRYLHKGIDLVNRPKCVVWAAQPGNVIIKDRFFTTGNTVVLDHGLGIFTLYAHLEDFADLEVGKTMKKGDPLGRMGMTGYANGYHLHWELRINNIAVDPIEWVSKIY